MRQAVSEGCGFESHEIEKLIDTIVDSLLRPLLESRHCGDIAANCHMRKEAYLLQDIADSSS